MNCRECQEQFEARLSGQPDGNDRIAFDAHLQQCSACASAFAEERKLWTLLGRTAQVEPSHGFADRVLRQLDEPVPSRSPWWSDFRFWPRWVVGAAAVMFLCVAAGWFHHQKRVEQETARLQHFEELFSVAQVDDPDAILMITPGWQNGDTL